ncbi:hypothetical protein [Nocardia sp. NRRL S-836]|uniref:hypothetical protein n=1 Tax=Nocardia sp. NRRL S-836 TaxID=1519492 RepID=UPI000ABCF82E|nr:hypothetical protein [Nocardia sp. NRRL S-836]
MDLNALWALFGRSASQTADQEARLEWLTSAGASVPAARIAWPDREGVEHVAGEALPGVWDSAEPQSLRVRELVRSPERVGERWDFADPREMARRVPRSGAVFGEVA